MPTQHNSRTYFELIEAFSQPDCAACRIVDAAVHGYIDMFLYENVNNLARRHEIRAARGFCTYHGDLMMAGYGRKGSTALLQQDILHDVVGQLDQAAPESHWPNLFRRRQSAAKAVVAAIAPQIDCPLCTYERIQTTVVLRTLADDALDPAMLAAFERSAGLCLPHFRMILELEGVAPDKSVRLIEVERRILGEAMAQLDEYVRKQITELVSTGPSEEGDAPARVTRLTSGRIQHVDGRRER